MDYSISESCRLANISLGVALAVSMITASWAAQRTILKALPACPDIKDFTDWFEAMEKGDASRAVDIIDGKGCVEVNKGELVRQPVTADEGVASVIAQASGTPLSVFVVVVKLRTVMSKNTATVC